MLSISGEDLKKLESQISTGNFDVTFEKDDGDANPPAMDASVNNSVGNAPAVNFAVALTGFWSFINLCLQIFCGQTSGVIEYVPLSQAELQSLGASSAQSPHFQKLAAAENAPTWLVVANAIGMFGKNIKYNKARKQELSNKRNEKEIENEIARRQAVLAKVSKPRETIKIEKLAAIHNAEDANPPPIDKSQYDEVIDPVDAYARDLLAGSQMTPQEVYMKSLQAKRRSTQIRAAEIAAEHRAQNSGVGYA